MKNREKNLKGLNVRLTIFSLTAMSILNAGTAFAADDEAAALMNPTSSVTVEEIYVSQGSQKFGEYNGLNKQGGYLNGNLNIKGGDGYKKNEDGDTSRWSVTGNDLGLTTRSANIGSSNQGSWNVGLGYDELTNNLAPGYQTPYQGSVGGNRFSLPSNFFPTGAPPAGQPGTQYNTNTQSLNYAQQGDFKNTDISSTRKNTSFTAGLVVDSNTNLTFDFNHLDQSGAKLMAFASSSWAAPTGGVAAQGVSILPNPTNYQTDTVNLAANWKGEKSHFTASYFGSFFRDGSNGVQFQTFLGNVASAHTGSRSWDITAGLNSNNFETMSTAPSNTLHQINLSGGYDLATKTKVTGDVSVSRNTQNTSSAYDSYQIGALAPVSPFNGLVNTTHANFKVSDQSIRDLTLAAGYKFDGRDNLSQSTMNSFNSISSAGAYYPNTPLSYKNSIFELSGAYKLTKDQLASLTYNNQYLNQYCNQYAVGSGSYTATNIPPAGTVVANNYPAGANCVTTSSSITNKLTALYRNKISEDFNIRLGYVYDVRSANNAPTAIAAFTDASVAPNYLPGVNGNNFVGFQPFFEASRIEQVVKANANWQASESVSFGLSGKYAYDNYTASTYGVQNGNKWSVNLDANYNYAERGAVTAYATQQSAMRNLLSYCTNANQSACYNAAGGTFNNNLTQNDTTLGIGFKHAGLLQEKLTLLGDLTYSLGQSTYSTALNYTPTTSCASTGTCGTLPAITNRMAAIKLGSLYQIDKHSALGLRYAYQHLISNDYYYNGYQYGITPTSVLPTNQTSGSYNVNVIAASYSYTFD